MSRRDNLDDIRGIVRELIDQEFGGQHVSAEGSSQSRRQGNRRGRGAGHLLPRGGSRGHGQGRRAIESSQNGNNTRRDGAISRNALYRPQASSDRHRPGRSFVSLVYLLSYCLCLKVFVIFYDFIHCFYRVFESLSHMTIQLDERLLV